MDIFVQLFYQYANFFTFFFCTDIFVVKIHVLDNCYVFSIFWYKKLFDLKDSLHTSNQHFNFINIFLIAQLYFLQIKIIWSYLTIFDGKLQISLRFVLCIYLKVLSVYLYTMTKIQHFYWRIVWNDDSMCIKLIQTWLNPCLKLVCFISWYNIEILQFCLMKYICLTINKLHCFNSSSWNLWYSVPGDNLNKLT